jgi:hypothetical protein
MGSDVTHPIIALTRARTCVSGNRKTHHYPSLPSLSADQASDQCGIKVPESEGTVAGYKVLIDSSDRVFATADEAVAACKRIVDECLLPGTTAAALYESFGDGPLIVPVDPADALVAFSAWAYAKERCEVLGARPPIVIPADEDVTADYVGTVISTVGVKPRA